MKITKEERNFILMNEQIITNLLDKRISDLKEEILDVPEEKRESWIQWLKEYKIAKGMLQEILKDKNPETFSGI